MFIYLFGAFHYLLHTLNHRFVGILKYLSRPLPYPIKRIDDEAHASEILPEEAYALTEMHDPNSGPVHIFSVDMVLMIMDNVAFHLLHLKIKN